MLTFLNFKELPEQKGEGLRMSVSPLRKSKQVSEFSTPKRSRFIGWVAAMVVEGKRRVEGKPKYPPNNVFC